jgi:hypothetical protein
VIASGVIHDVHAAGCGCARAAKRSGRPSAEEDRMCEHRPAWPT